MRILASFALATAMTAGTAQAQEIDTVAKVKASGEIRMGVRESSGQLSYLIMPGQYGGFHVELCDRIIRNLESAVGRRLTVVQQTVSSTNRISLLTNGTIDIECGATTNNATRQKDVAFLDTTYVEEVRVAVRSSSGFNSINQLEDKTVGTTAGTTSVQLLRKHQRAEGVKFQEVFGKDHTNTFLLLESGRVDAFVMDGQILAGLIAFSKDPAAFRICCEVLSVEPIAIMIRKDDAALRKIGNDTISQLVKSGELQKMYDKWFMQPVPPKNIRVGLPTSESTRAAWTNLNDRPAEAYAIK